MLDITQSGPSQLNTHDHAAHLFIRLADQLRMAGHHAAAMMLINLAYQHFDAETEEGAAQSILATDDFSIYHSNDNSKWTSLQNAKCQRRQAFLALAGHASEPIPQDNSVIAGGCAGQMDRSVISQSAITVTPRSSHIGRALRQLVLGA